MGIYGKKPSLDIDFGSGLKKAKLPIAILAVIVCLVVLSPFVLDLFKPNPLALEFKQNPIKAGESTIISIKVQNTLNQDVEGVSVSLKAIDGEALVIRPTRVDIGVLGAGENRVIESISVRANPSKEVLAGSYEIEARLLMGGKEFIERRALQIVSK